MNFFLTIFILVIFQVQVFGYGGEKIGDISCNEINKTVRYKNLSSNVIDRIDLVGDKINNKYIDKDNTYKEKLYELFIKILNEHLEKTKYSEVQKEILLRIGDYFVCKKEEIKNLNLDLQGNGELKSQDLVSRIWYDTYNASDVKERVSMVNSDRGYFTPEAFHNVFPSPDVKIINAWYEVFEAGNGSSCSPTINKVETNTVVEVGKIRMWVLYPNGRVKVDDSFATEGITMPSSSDPYFNNNYKGCPKFESLRSDHPINTFIDINNEGHPLVKPAYYWNRHGWGDLHYKLKTDHKAIFIQQYFRKVIQNSNLPDDRSISHYVAHVGSDNKLPSGRTIGGEPGTSGFREIGNDWTLVTFLSKGISEKEFIFNPPPFINLP